MAKRSGFSQALPPGYQTTGEPFTGNYEIVWSLYIKCNNLQKLRKVHIPALEALIGQPHGGKGWLCENEDYNENRDRSLTRIIAVERLEGPYTDQLLLDFLKTLYSLSSFWAVQAHLDPSHPQGVYVMAQFQQENPGSEAPAVVDALVELQASPVDGGSIMQRFGATRRISANGQDSGVSAGQVEK